MSTEPSYATVYALAVRESTRLEMNRAIDTVYRATHCAVYRDSVYCFGSKAKCEDFANRLRGVTVREITDLEKHAEAKHIRKVYRNP